MANDTTNVQPDDMSLEQLDQVLEQMDPGITQSLDEVKKVVSASDVHIESEAVGDEPDGLVSEAEVVVSQKRGWIKEWLHHRKTNISASLSSFRIAFIGFIKTAPKEFIFYLLSILKGIGKALGRLLKAFGNLEGLQKFGVLILTGMIFLTGALVYKNLHGLWLPLIDKPVLAGFENHSDQTFTFDDKDTIPFLKAFPQDPEIFLFDKIKVNLRRNTEHPLPMAAMEIYAQVDSRDTAIELQSRQVELHDLIERTIEGQTYDELNSELGKNRLKGILKHDLDQVLTQGWVTDIHFKTFILKP